MIYGPHCHHADLCSMAGCDQRGHIDFPCHEQATCTFCAPDAPCPMNPDITTSECPDCHV